MITEQGITLLNYHSPGDAGDWFLATSGIRMELTVLDEQEPDVVEEPVPYEIWQNSFGLETGNTQYSSGGLKAQTVRRTYSFSSLDTQKTSIIGVALYIEDALISSVDLTEEVYQPIIKKVGETLEVEYCFTRLIRSEKTVIIDNEMIKLELEPFEQNGICPFAIGSTKNQKAMVTLEENTEPFVANARVELQRIKLREGVYELSYTVSFGHPDSLIAPFPYDVLKSVRLGTDTLSESGSMYWEFRTPITRDGKKTFVLTASFEEATEVF